MLSIQAWFLLLFSKGLIRFLNFEQLCSWLGKKGSETPHQISDWEAAEVEMVSRIVVITAGVTPWVSDCLPQAITAKRLLFWKGIPSTLYLGAAFKTRTEMEAHAWLRCGPVFVTGGDVSARFGQLVSFGE